MLTTLIPAYNQAYLGEALISLARQSVKPTKVILSDDSPGHAISEMIKEGRFEVATRHLNLTVVPGPKESRQNHEQLFDLWGGSTDFVHLLNDDDVILPEFYRTHLMAHRECRLSASVTPRWLSMGDSVPTWTLPLPSFIEDSPLRTILVDSETLVKSTLPSCTNWLGELTNIVLSADTAKRFPRPPIDELSYYGLMDISTLLSADPSLPIAFVRDHLSVFRQHPQQSTNSLGTHGHRVTMLVWAPMAMRAWQQGRITHQDAIAALTITLQRYQQLYSENDPVMTAFVDVLDAHSGGMQELHDDIQRFWLSLLASDRSTQPRRSESTFAQLATAT